MRAHTLHAKLNSRQHAVTHGTVQAQPHAVRHPAPSQSPRLHQVRHSFQTLRTTNLRFYAGSVRRAVVTRAQLEDTLPADFQEVADEVKEALQGTSLYLVGMMGSGKSTIGKIVGRALRYSFFDTDTLIEQLTETTIPEIFASEGEDAFREVETQVLQELAPFKECIVATGGGIVTRGINWGHMQHGIVIWLCGSPELLAGRVVEDGTKNRPMLSQVLLAVGQEEGGEGGDERAAAVERLTKLLDDRRKQYEFSDIQVSLEGAEGKKKNKRGKKETVHWRGHSGAPAGEVAYRVLAALRKRIKDDAALREERKNFNIEYAEDVPSMKVMQSPVKQNDPHLP